MVTTQANLYKVLCEVVTLTTGRKCWTKAGIQATPNFPYVTVYLEQGASPATQDVVEVTEAVGPNGETLQERPWGTQRLDCVVEFFRDTIGDSAQIAANRFKNGLQLSSRYDDLWQIAGFVGAIRVIDVSAIFRSDTESRSQVRFGLYANIADPSPLPDAAIYDIASQEVGVFRDTNDPADEVGTIDINGGVTQ